ncbi:hypothetical protein BH23CHL2_BH23CHL2_07250 [soil metagenome]
MTAAAPESRPARPAGDRVRLAAVAGQLDRLMESGQLPALLVVVVTGLLLGSFLLTDDYRVESVTIDGIRYGDADEIVAESGMLDQSSFRVNLEQAAERIALLPYVERVTVELSFPGRASISIQERRPEIVVDQAGEFSLVSLDGIIIAPGDVEGLPQLRSDRSGALNEDALTPELVGAVRSLAGVYGPLTMLLWNQEIGLVMERPDERLVIFGEPDQIEAKLAVLSALESQIDADWTQLDLRVPTRPAYR